MNWYDIAREATLVKYYQNEYNNVYKTDNENAQGNGNDYERKKKKASKTLQLNNQPFIILPT